MQLDIVCNDTKYLPTYANDTDACMDLKVKIEDHLFILSPDKTHVEKGTYLLKSGETKIFGTGIQVSIPKDYVMLIFPRSSTGIKLHCMLTNTTGVIDTGYRDEIKMALTNFGNQTIKLEDGQRIAQFMIIPRPKIELNLVKDDILFRNNDRGGGVGSTGK